MLDTITGKENLPNLYIKDVIVNTSNTDTGGITSVGITCVAKDYTKSATVPWTTDPVVRKNLFGLVVLTDSEAISAGLSGGNQTMDVSNLKKMDPDAYVEIKTFPLSAMSIDDDDLPTNSVRDLKITSNFKVHAKSGKNITAFVTFAMNLSSMISKIGGLNMENMGFVHGPVASEVVLQSNSPPSLMYAFQDRGGKIHSGPIHSHAGMIMEGSFHSSVPHKKLRTISVPNVKVVNLKKINIEVRPPTPVNSKIPIVSNMYYTTDEGSRFIDAHFFVNGTQMIKKHSKMGKNYELLTELRRELVPSYPQMSPRMRVYKEFLDCRKKGSFISNKNTNVKVYKRVLAAQMNSSGGHLYEAATEDNILKTRFTSSKIHEDKSYRLLSKMTLQHYDAERDIFSVRVHDYDFDTKQDVHFRYTLEIDYKDNYDSFVSTLITKIEKHLLALEGSYHDINRGMRIPRAIIRDIAPLVTFRAIVSNNSTQIKNSDISKIIYSLNRNKPEALLSFISDTKRTLYIFKNMYDIKTKTFYQGHDLSQKIYSKDYYDFRIKHTFNEIIHSREFHKTYTFQRNAKNGSIENIPVSINDLKNDVSFSLDVKRKERQAAASPNETVTNNQPYKVSPSATNIGKIFMTPSVISVGGSQMMLLDNPINYKQVNSFYSKNLSPAPKINFSFFPTLPSEMLTNIEEKDIDYSAASEYLGDDSSFLIDGTDIQKITANLFKTTGHGSIPTSTIDVLKSHITSDSLVQKYKNKNNVLGSLKNKGSYIVPEQISLLASTNRVSMINNVAASPIDKIAMPELSRKIDLDHFIVTEIMSLSGFVEDSDGNIMVNSPIWSRQDPNQEASTRFAKIEYWQSPELSHKIPDDMKFTISEKYFFLGTKPTIFPNRRSFSLFTRVKEIQSQLSLLFDSTTIEYFTTNPVTQTKERLGLGGMMLEAEISPSAAIAQPALEPGDFLPTAQAPDAPQESVSTVVQASATPPSPVTTSAASTMITPTTGGGGGYGGY